MLFAKTKYTALVTKHVNKIIQTFSCLFSNFTKNGPARSTPVAAKGATYSVLKLGKKP